MEDVQMAFTIYAMLTASHCQKTKATFGFGVICTGLMGDGSCFKSGATLSLTFIETGILTKRVLVSLVLATGLEIAICML